MNKKLSPILQQIDSCLLQENIHCFKVGKSESAKERFADDDYAGYYYLSVVATGNKEEIFQAEKDFIKYFLHESAAKDKCQNEIEGSPGNEEATELYIAAKRKVEEEDDRRYDQAMGPVELFDFKTIKL